MVSKRGSCAGLLNRRSSILSVPGTELTIFLSKLSPDEPRVRWIGKVDNDEVLDFIPVLVSREVSKTNCLNVKPGTTAQMLHREFRHGTQSTPSQWAGPGESDPLMSRMGHANGMTCPSA